MTRSGKFCTSPSMLKHDKNVDSSVTKGVFMPSNWSCHLWLSSFPKISCWWSLKKTQFLPIFEFYNLMIGKKHKYLWHLQDKSYQTKLKNEVQAKKTAKSSNSTYMDKSIHSSDFFKYMTKNKGHRWPILSTHCKPATVASGSMWQFFSNFINNGAASLHLNGFCWTIQLQLQYSSDIIWFVPSHSKDIFCCIKHTFLEG